jgi:hypothetical protein
MCSCARLLSWPRKRWVREQPGTAGAFGLAHTSRWQQFAVAARGVGFRPAIRRVASDTMGLRPRRQESSVSLPGRTTSIYEGGYE